MVLIGIDGGATKISAWEIIYDKKNNTFSLGSTNVFREYRHYDEFIQDFSPVELSVQLAEMNGDIGLTQDEMVQGEVYMNACTDVITELAAKHRDKKILIGIGMPGLKTADKRGIAALANGPRMPYFANVVESKLKERGIKLYDKVAKLGSDADYCGIGEEYAEKGEFKNCKNAYYLGGGTGIADAIKLKGRLIPFDEIKDWIAKTWELKSEDGLSLERYTSASGIQFIFSLNSGLTIEKLNEKRIFPPQILEAALNNDINAINTLKQISKNLAQLIFERITTVYFGWNHHFEFINPNRQALESEHPYKGTLFDKIIIGQRLGDLLMESIGTGILFDEMIELLMEMTKGIADINFKKHYLTDNIFNKDLICFSNLREAPAIGAGIDAYLTKFN